MQGHAFFITKNVRRVDENILVHAVKVMSSTKMNYCNYILYNSQFTTNQSPVVGPQNILVSLEAKQVTRGDS